MNDSLRYPASRWLVLIAAVFSYISLQVANLSIAPLLPVVGKDLSLAPSQLATLMSVYTFSGCIVMLWLGGAIVDRFGPFLGILLGLITAAVPMTMMPIFGHSFQGLVWMRIIEGLAAGFAFPAQALILAQWFGPNQRGLASGLMGSSVTLGAAGGLMAGPALVGMGQSWQTMSLNLSYFAWAGVVYVLILMASKIKPPVTEGAMKHTAAFSLLKKALFTRLTFFGIAATFMVAWVFQCLMSLVPGALATDRPLGAGYSAMQSGTLMQGVTIAGIIGPIVAGFMVDKFFKGNPKPAMLLGYAAMFIFMGLMIFPVVLYTPSILIVSLIMSGLGFQFIFPLIFVLIGKVYPLPVVGQMMGLWDGVGTLGGVLGIALGGIVAQATGTYMWAYAMMSIAAFLGFFLCIALFKQKPVTFDHEAASH
jgi:MFS family permease